MSRWLSLCVAFCLPFALSVTAKADKPEAPEKDSPSFQIRQHLIGPAVGFDKEGRCKVIKGAQLKAWLVPGFPAKIPHFESCTRVFSPQGGTVEFRIVVKDKAGEEISAVDGVLELGSPGSGSSASQAIDWDDLEIPSAGLYHMLIEIEGRETARFPMRFSHRSGKGRRKTQ